jgi:Rps23 Pro-64 3,4-dihydroxylase Tpa1-like proline 4-hydroxylase
MSLIHEIKNVIPSNICKEIINRFEKSDEKSEGQTTAGIDLELKKTTDLNISIDNKLWIKINRYVSEKMMDQVIKYIKHLSSNVYKFSDNVKFFNAFGEYFGGDLSMTGLQIQKYEPGDYFKPHIDSGGITDTRLLALILYLNTVDENQGGETWFYNDQEIRPEEGKLLIFPCTWTYLHEGKQIKEGYKYIITCFIHTNPPNSEYKIWSKPR